MEMMDMDECDNIIVGCCVLDIGKIGKIWVCTVYVLIITLRDVIVMLSLGKPIQELYSQGNQALVSLLLPPGNEKKQD
jgi:hypothetical protein